MVATPPARVVARVVGRTTVGKADAELEAAIGRAADVGSTLKVDSTGMTMSLVGVVAAFDPVAAGSTIETATGLEDACTAVLDDTGMALELPPDEAPLRLAQANDIFVVVVPAS